MVRERKSLLFRVGQVADMTGVPPSTIRDWQRHGLVTGIRTNGGHRLFAQEDVQRVRQVKGLLARRKTMKEVEEALSGNQGLATSRDVVEPMSALAYPSQDLDRSRLLEAAAANARLFLEEHRLAKDLAALQSVADVALSGLGADELFQRMIERIVQLLDVTGGAMFLVDENGNFVLRGQHGLPPDMPPVFSKDAKVAGWILKSPGAPAFPDFLSHFDGMNGETPRGVSSILAAPLRVRLRPIGFVCLYTSTPRTFSDAESHLLEIMAARVGMAVDSARLYEDALEAMKRASAMNEIAQAALSNLSPGKVIGVALQKIRELIPCDCACIAVPDSETNEVSIRRQHDEPDSDSEVELRLPLGSDGLRELTEARRVLSVPDLAAKEPPLREIEETLLQKGMHSVIRVPLIVDGRVFGHLGLCRKETKTFCGRDEMLVRELSGQVAVAVLSAHLRERSERQKAELTRRVEEVSRSEAKYRVLLENVGDGIAILNEGGRYIEVNQRFCDLLGRSSVEILGRKMGEFTSETKQGVVAKQFERVRKEGEVFGGALAVRPDGSTVPFLVRGRSLSIGGQTVYLGVFTDLS